SPEPAAYWTSSRRPGVLTTSESWSPTFTSANFGIDCPFGRFARASVRDHLRTSTEQDLVGVGVGIRRFGRHHQHLAQRFRFLDLEIDDARASDQCLTGDGHLVVEVLGAAVENVLQSMV